MKEGSYRPRAAARLAAAIAGERDLSVGRLAVQRGLITAAQLEDVLGERERSGGGLVDLIERRGWAKRADLEALDPLERREELARAMLARMPDAPAEVLPLLGRPDRELAEFVLVSLAGEGGGGEVWRAWDRRLGRWVAIKTPSSRLVTPLSWERFRREVQAAARLDHPNIVPVYGVDQHEGKPYIVMRLVEGRTLNAGRMPLRQALEVLRTAALAVEFAHGRGIVHRDLKPANIMLDTAGTVWLLDFGLAHLEDGGAVTRTGSMAGTPSYMSPEQARGGAEARRPATDIYSLGATLYELATGRLPFPGDSATEVVRKVMDEDPRRPREVDPSIPRDVETVILKAMDKIPARRYAAAGDLAEDLRRILAGEPIAARPESWTRQAVRRIRRHALPVVASAAVVAVLSVAGFEIFRELQRGRNRAADTEALKLLEAARPQLDRAERAFSDAQSDPVEIDRQLGRAQALIEQARDRAPHLALPHYLLGRTWDLRGDEDRAEACWRRAIALDPGFGPAHYQLARLIILRAYLIGTVVDAGRRSAAPRPALIREAMAQLDRAEAGISGLDDELQRRIATVLASVVRDDLDAARELAIQGLRDLSGREGIEELHLVAALTLPQGRRRKDVDEALQRRPLYPAALVFRANEWIFDGRDEEAIRDLSSALRIWPRFIPALLNRGSARQFSGDLDGAATDYEAVIAIDSGRAIAYTNRGTVHIGRGDLDRAAADFETAIRLNPADPLVYVNRAGLKARKGETEGAIDDCGVAIRLNASFPGAYITRGQVRLARREGALALADFDAALELDPGSARTLAGRGMALKALGRTDEAAADLERSLARDPRQPDAWVHLAEIREAKGDRNGASAGYRRALDLLPPASPVRPRLESKLDRLLGK